jgi:hypothetical protein
MQQGHARYPSPSPLRADLASPSIPPFTQQAVAAEAAARLDLVVASSEASALKDKLRETGAKQEHEGRRFGQIESERDAAKAGVRCLACLFDVLVLSIDTREMQCFSESEPQHPNHLHAMPAL